MGAGLRHVSREGRIVTRTGMVTAARLPGFDFPAVRLVIFLATEEPSARKRAMPLVNVLATPCS